MALRRPWLGLGSDFRLAARRLAATPLFLLFAVLSLGVGVAVPTTVYSTLYELMWKPVGVSRQHEVVLVTTRAFASDRWGGLAAPDDFRDLVRSQRSFGAIAAFMPAGQSISAASVSEVVDIEAVSGSFFDVVAIRPLLGRLLQTEDDDRAAPVVVLGEQFWRRRLDADPTIVGRAVRIGGYPFDVVGIVPESFLGLTSGGPQRPEVWIPLASLAHTGNRLLLAPDRDRRVLSIVARLAPGQSLESSAAEMRSFGASLDAQYPMRVAGPNSAAQPTKRLWSAIRVEDRRPLPGLRVDLLLLGLVFLVLVVACTNLGNLLLSRGADRAHEFSVRRALGASRWRLVRELLVESALIVMLAAAITYPLTGALMWLVTMEVPIGHGAIVFEPRLSVPAAVVAACALLASMLVFGLEPALTLTRGSMNVQLASQAGASPPRRRRRQQAFIRWQVATSVCFFLIAAVLVRLMIRDMRHDPGIALDELSIASVHFSLQGWDEARARRTLLRAQELGGEYSQVRSIAVSSGLPFGIAMTPHAQLTTPDKPFVKGQRYETAEVLVASSNIFTTLGVHIVSGRGFDGRDENSALTVEWSASTPRSSCLAPAMRSAGN